MNIGTNRVEIILYEKVEQGSRLKNQYHRRGSGGGRKMFDSSVRFPSKSQFYDQYGFQNSNFATNMPLARCHSQIFVLNFIADAYGAQFFHFKVKNPFIQKLPSLVLLIFCLALVYFSCPS